MSTTVPPSASGGDITTQARPSYHRQQQVHTHRYNQRSATRHYCNNSSSQSLSDSSASDRSFSLENGVTQQSPLPPPLPKRPLRHQQRAPHVSVERTVTHDVEHHRNRDSYYCWSDGSGSTRLPTFPEEDDRSCPTELDDQHIRLHHYNRRVIVKSNKYPSRSTGRLSVGTAVVYPSAGYYPADTGVVVQQPADGRNVLLTSTTRTPTASPSSVAGYVGGAGASGYVARGCGGRCETCENVCYYLLQVAFAMGIFIGTSLCIAGATLRRSPSRQLQVLLYIGALVALVSALLLIVQCRARRQANRYYQQQRHNNIPMGVTPMQTQLQPVQQQVGNAMPTKLVAMANNKVAYSGSQVYKPQLGQKVVTTIQRGAPVTMLQHGNPSNLHGGGNSSATWWR